MSSEGLVASNAPSLRFIEEGRLRSLAALQSADRSRNSPLNDVERVVTPVRLIGEC